MSKGARACCNVLCVLQRVAVFGSLLQCAAVCCSALQCIAICCSVLQRQNTLSFNEKVVRIQIYADAIT